jgi:peptidyl-prolyl cis-trans isomerase B (cyclophilin B)
MLKRSLWGIPAVVLLLGLSACGGDDNGSEATDDTSSSPSETSSSPTDYSSTEVTESEGAPAAGGPTCEYVPDGSNTAEAPPAIATVEGDVAVTLETSVGAFNATLDGEKTPCTVNSFVSLAEQGYFDGTSCHRMTTEGIFVLQCGDPTGTGAGGPGYSFPDELSGQETYGPGTLAMANAGPDTNGSQFFIVYGDSPLPPSYTVFGTVDQDTIDLVTEVADAGTNPPSDGAPTTPVDIESVEVG